MTNRYVYKHSIDPYRYMSSTHQVGIICPMSFLVLVQQPHIEIQNFIHTVTKGNINLPMPVYIYGC